MKNSLLFISIIGLFLYTSETTSQTVTDIDGNEYPVITIGEQEWMGENMRVTHYNNGDEIENNPDHTYWQESTEGLWEHYDKDPENADLYGKLYNWHATVDERGLCPAGWRVPTNDDWQQLIEYVDPNAWGNNNTLGTKLKSCRQVGSPLGVDCDVTEHPRWDLHGRRFGTDEYGFGALPGGAYTMGAAFVNMGKYAYFWSTTSAAGNNAWTRVMLFSHRGMSRNQYNKSMGMAVRCIKGEEQEVHVPQLNTLQVTDITQTTAVSGGDIISDGGAEVTERGIVWCTNSNPTLEENIDMTSDGSGMGTFTSDITGLQQEKTYWVRAYATNEAGTAYGTQKRFSTLGEEVDGENIVSVNDVTGQPGETITIEVEVDNTDGFVAFQMDFALPEGFALVEGSIELTDRADDHSADYNELDDNVIRIISYSPNNNPYSGNEGIIITFNLTTPEVEGEWELFADEVVLTNPDYENIFTGSNVGVITLVETTGWTPCPDIPTVEDIDGNVYNTVLIGEQCWIRENLRVTKYNNEDEIIKGSSSDNWSNANNNKEGAYGVYPYESIDGLSSESEVIEAYGLLYNWYSVVDGRGLCPPGWDVPSSDQWTFMVNCVSEQGYPNSDEENGAGNALKSCRQVNSSLGAECDTNNHPRWDFNETHQGFDAFGFSALPGGRRHDNGSFLNIGRRGKWWTTTESSETFAYGRYMYSNSGHEIDNAGSKGIGRSVRCIKLLDSPPSSHTLNIEINPENSGTTEGAGEYEAGTEINITAIANEGYEFVNWTIGDDVLSTETEYTYTMPGEDVTIVANFEDEDDETSWTPCPDMPTVEDIDGNVYNTVLIGDQCWMRENLRVTQYNNGDAIPTGLSDTEWENTTVDAYAIYPYEDIDGFESEEEVVEAYGKLYNWYAVDDARGLCPTGWRVPNDAEWTELVDYVVAQGYPNSDVVNGAGNALKSCRQVDSPLGGDCATSEHPRWDSDGTHYGFDEFGFSALPGGLRYWSGAYGSIGYYGGYWWSSTEYSSADARHRFMGRSRGGVLEGYNSKAFGFSVRCLREID